MQRLWLVAYDIVEDPARLDVARTAPTSAAWDTAAPAPTNTTELFEQPQWLPPVLRAGLA